MCNQDGIVLLCEILRELEEAKLARGSNQIVTKKGPGPAGSAELRPHLKRDENLHKRKKA